MSDDLQKPTPEQLCYSKLLAYVVASWNGYQIARHHLIVANALQAVESGEIRRLIINLPPRSGKTMLVSEFFPAWYWGRNPDRKIIFVTHGQDKADDVGRSVRDQMTDPLHTKIFPVCNIAPSSKSIHRMNTLQRGEYFSIGLGGQIVGRGAHLLIIDDPIKGREAADSALKQGRLKSWYQGDAYTRLMANNAIIVCQTRWTNNDLTGWLLTEHKRENWTVISIPALAEVDGDIIRRNTGDPLWPELEIFEKEYLEFVKLTVGTREWNAQYQQRPVDIEGGIIKLAWFKYYTKKPEFERIVQSIDTAFKPEQLNDPSVCLTWGIAKDGYYLLDVLRERLEYPKLKAAIKKQYEDYKPSAVLIEDRGSGQSLIQDLRADTRIPVIAIPTENLSKEIRMSVESDKIEAGKVWLPEKAPWLVDYESEMTQFPLYTHDDMVDATSQFLKWIENKGYSGMVKVSGT
jgi:predicted phage terminase large subunit-like protein